MLARRDSILGQILITLIVLLAFDSEIFLFSLRFLSLFLSFHFLLSGDDLSVFSSIRKSNFRDYINSKSILPMATLVLLILYPLFPAPLFSLSLFCLATVASLNYRGESLRVLQLLDTGINGNAVTHLSARYDSRRRWKIRSLENYTTFGARANA